jgi:hypothetical protein
VAGRKDSNHKMSFKKQKTSAPVAADQLSKRLSEVVDQLGELEVSKKEIERKREIARAEFLELAEEVASRNPSANDDDVFSKTFKWPSSSGEFAYQRTPVEKGRKFDGGNFLVDFPHLDIVDVSTVITYTLNEEAAQAYLSENPEFLSTLQDYVIPGKTEIHLRKVKADAQED